MNVTSADGTSIAYGVQGAGAPLIIVNGALSTKAGETQAELVGELAPHFRRSTATTAAGAATAAMRRPTHVAR